MFEGGPFGDKNFSKKSRTVPKKIQKEDPIDTSSLVSYVKNGINERGTLSTNLDSFPLAGPVV